MFSLGEARIREVRPAQEERLGMWINGVDEDTVLFLLHLGVPVFIVHEMNTYE
jgi:hypothetical protein